MLSFHDRLVDERGIGDASGFSSNSRCIRFGVILRCLKQFGLGHPDMKRIRLLDYGCYDGELFEFLNHIDSRVDYVGVDINQKFIEWAKECRKHRVDGAQPRFMVGDVLMDETLDKLRRLKPDVIVASGVLCYKCNAQRYPEMLWRLFDCATKGMIFNALAADTPITKMPLDRAILRWKPEELLKLVKACGCKSWEVIRSYLHNDMTVVMRKHWTHFK